MEEKEEEEEEEKEEEEEEDIENEVEVTTPPQETASAATEVVVEDQPSTSAETVPVPAAATAAASTDEDEKKRVDGISDGNEETSADQGSNGNGSTISDNNTTSSSSNGEFKRPSRRTMLNRLVNDEAGIDELLALKSVRSEGKSRRPQANRFPCSPPARRSSLAKQWECKTCTLINEPDKQTCAACGRTRDRKGRDIITTFDQKKREMIISDQKRIEREIKRKREAAILERKRRKQELLRQKEEEEKRKLEEEMQKKKKKKREEEEAMKKAQQTNDEQTEGSRKREGETETGGGDGLTSDEEVEVNPFLMEGHPMYLSNGQLELSEPEDHVEEESSDEEVVRVKFPTKVKKIVRKKSMERWLTVHNGEIFYAKTAKEVEDTNKLDEIVERLSHEKYANSAKLSDSGSSVCWIPCYRIIGIETWAEGSLAITTRNGSKKKSKTFWFKPKTVSTDALQTELTRVWNRARAVIKVV
mmetsp:Transcript_18167/g.36632  ORF Transcript_18167/g.36632 Transcript_18167/m.36632 type:complete len:474 (+) Transcript_18167:585-2006(+)